MSDDENDPPRYGTKVEHCCDDFVLLKKPSALTQRRRKRPNLQTDPLVHHGRHFGRTVFAFANIHALLVAGINADEDKPPQTQQERRELRVFKKLIAMIPGFEERIFSLESEEELMGIANLLQQGASGGRSDDTKGLKGPILDWIVPPTGEPLQPPLSRNIKVNRGFNHNRTGFLLCPAELDWSNPDVQAALRNKELSVTGAHWPKFVYKDEQYNPTLPWKGLFRSELLVKVFRGFKHIFTSPSSVDDEPRATRSGNARIHGMNQVTRPSLAYVATQVRFALTSSATFSRTDLETDSETFFTSVLECLEDPREQDEVKPLLAWWNQRIFPSFSTTRRLAPDNSVLAMIRLRREGLIEAQANVV
ncbi:hypothetical protein DFP72DRAFT_846283 [Ephemerocybe angulata]|uniref:Uncharacterized protein n=1 Tax=Ephemerocybe angulata TaxID=980116 RepID=A0A8H6I197_9AGAR|nr:hypothetical protein DFP72DRAFT_846283 [Tulosesus angulatus]